MYVWRKCLCTVPSTTGFVKEPHFSPGKDLGEKTLPSCLCVVAHKQAIHLTIFSQRPPQVEADMQTSSVIGRHLSSSVSKQAKVKLTQPHVIEYRTSEEQKECFVGPVRWERRAPQGGLRPEADREYELTVTNPQKHVLIIPRTSAIAMKKNRGRSAAVKNNRPETARTPDAPGKHSIASGRHRIWHFTSYYGGTERALPPFIK